MTPPDYWPDARRLRADKLDAVVEAVRAVRDARGLSNADLCRDVRELIERHNAVPGRTKVDVARLAEPWEFKEQGKYELSAIQKGTRKYLVGYLAWLCLRDEAAARALYEEVGLTFRPYREADMTEGQTEIGTDDTETQDDDSPVAEESCKDEFLIYEAAFLWHGQMPPPAAVHQEMITPDIAQMKSLLHMAIELEKLAATEHQSGIGGYSRYVSREELKRFAQETGIFPRFLFPDRKPSPEEFTANIEKLSTELHQLLLQLPKPVTNWAEEYSRDEWAIYEAAFLWHGYAPPPISLHQQVMPDPVQRTKRMLHDAANSNALSPAADSGLRLRNVMVHGTRYVSRVELRRFATSIGQRPRFLFPEDDEGGGVA